MPIWIRFWKAATPDHFARRAPQSRRLPGARSAMGASENDINLVLWRSGSEPPSRVILIDDEKRLSVKY